MIDHGWTNKAHAGAWQKGWNAAEKGEPREACPYRRHPGGGPMNGSFAFGKAWRQGHEDYHRHNPPL